MGGHLPRLPPDVNSFIAALNCAIPLVPISMLPPSIFT